MSKAEDAVKNFENYNCAQSVLATYADDFDLPKEKALQTAVGFGAGMGRLQETCGAVSGAIAVLGLSSGFKEEDRRDKINKSYADIQRLVSDFTKRHGTVKCRDLLDGCNLMTDEGQKAFKDNNLREHCRNYIKLCCELLDGYLKE